MSDFNGDSIQLLHGQAQKRLHNLKSKSVQCIVTSPPYYGLRDYEHPEQLGNENSLEQYVTAIMDLGEQLHRVLADDGTFWLNLGDTYAGRANAGPAYTGNHQGFSKGSQVPPRRRTTGDAPYKNLLMVPARVALALQGEGWILRSDVIWHKPNPMPESVSDRPTSSHEHLFLFVKQPQYYYDAAAIAEPDRGKPSGNGFRRPEQINKGGEGSLEKWMPKGMRNKRDVWTVATVPFPEEHFAVFPPELIRPCILAGSRRGDTVLDPFSGSGTTGMVANQEGRQYIGIDINQEYLDLSLRTRFRQPALSWD